MAFITPNNVQVATWVVIGGFSAWGGLVRYIIEVQGKNKAWDIVGLLSQIVVSGFTGLLGGLLSFENGGSHYFTLAIAGLFGTMGSAALAYLWNRFFYTREEK
ncbi:holin [Chromobacterium sp. ATCC 53434]|uniref:phage holin family protein n=1 Tax=Chromobacterium TaxID=535 RepID=UPI000C7661D9|nr:phage holin family protein [Chromobacterium sp. ATCC 53434]AUH51662.1 holin [Chromobacterium sp. ATCC 53434]